MLSHLASRASYEYAVGPVGCGPECLSQHMGPGKGQHRAPEPDASMPGQAEEAWESEAPILAYGSRQRQCRTGPCVPGLVSGPQTGPVPFICPTGAKMLSTTDLNK